MSSPERRETPVGEQERGVELNDAKPLNLENWKILRNAEDHIKHDIHMFKYEYHGRPKVIEGNEHSVIEARRYDELHEELVRVRQMMREEAQEKNLKFEMIRE